MHGFIPQAVCSGCACRARQLLIRCNNKAIEQVPRCSKQRIKKSFNMISASGKKKLSKGFLRHEGEKYSY